MDIIRRFRKRALLKELKKWDDLMASYIDKIAGVDEEINETHKNNTIHITRLNQLKTDYEDAYNMTRTEAMRIREELKNI